ncbi:ankyrin repeat-containing protein ITN1-like [Punica granatum]|uniref:Ankyrin repeat-containing protein ITN1-like n=1 Tax=Punica granatum TaxID=22663 RepID=A0A6P8BQ22_PUNGR|nr:ankyrin repeat-containing protein ITN1-like [Punica granatum]XP_031371765.1 ankyrin repeat-containing protein ITN1-like [Punica granatum]XP_031371766.1 ankyrin repeat-containing protein ITN1-like [Punica granatum]
MTSELSQNSPADPSPTPSPSSRAPALVLPYSGKTIDQAIKKKYVKQVTGRHNDTELHLAAQHGDLAAVRQILNDIHSQMVGTLSGAELDAEVADVRVSVVNEVNELGETALFTAADRGHVELVKELLKYSNKECLMKKNRSGFDALHIASSRGHHAIVQVLLDHDSGLSITLGPWNATPLISASMRGHTAVVNELLAKDCSLIEITRTDGKNALHLAARYGHVEIVKALLDKDSRLARRTDKKGQTALHMAVKGQSCEVVRLILEADAAIVMLCDKVGNTALHVATKKKRVEIVHGLLLYPETNVNAVNREQKTALDIAEGLPFSEESMKIKAHLSRNGAVRGNDLLPVKELERNLQGGLIHNANSVNKAAVLIAQIAFAAIFTIPGSPVETSHNIPVQVLVIFNSIAFFASLAVVVIQTALGRGEAEAEVIAVMAEVTNKLIWLASACISVVFMATITIVVGRRCQWATILIMVVGGALIAGSLGIKTYYEVRRLRKIELIRKKET